MLVKNNQSQLKSNVVVYEDPTGIIIQLIKPIVGKIGDIKISSEGSNVTFVNTDICLLYTSPSPRDKRQSRMPSSA